MRWMLIAAVVLPAHIQDPPESTRDRILRLARDPQANREELLKIGPDAVRILLDLKSPGLDGILRDLRFSGAGAGADAIREKLVARTATLRVKNLPPAVVLGMLPDLTGVAVLLDPGLQAPLSKKTVSVDVSNGSAEDVLKRLGAQLGTDYAWIRGQIVMSTPERLWRLPPEQPRTLEGTELETVRARIARLAHESPEERAKAEEELLAMAETAAPFLEETAKTTEGELRVRARAVLDAILARSAIPILRRTMALERQKLSEGGKTILEALQTRRTTLNVGNMPFTAVLRLTLSNADVHGESSGAAGDFRMDAVFEEARLIDALFFITVPFGLDACLRDGGVWVDRGEAVRRFADGE